MITDDEIELAIMNPWICSAGITKRLAQELKDRRAKDAKVEPVMNEIAFIAHTGGMALSEGAALTRIRKLSLPWWNGREKYESAKRTVEPAPISIAGKWSAQNADMEQPVVKAIEPLDPTHFTGHDLLIVYKLNEAINAVNELKGVK